MTVRKPTLNKEIIIIIKIDLSGQVLVPLETHTTLPIFSQPICGIAS